MANLSLSILHVLDPGMLPEQRRSVEHLAAEQAARGDSVQIDSDGSQIPADSGRIIHTHGAAPPRIPWSPGENLFHIHTCWENPLRTARSGIGGWSPLRRRAPRTVGALVTLCDSDRLELASLHYVPQGKLHHVPPGLDLERFRNAKDRRGALRAALNVKPGQFLIGSAAPFVAGRDHGEILRAVHILVKGGADLHVLLAGAGPERGRMESLVQELGLQARVNFVAADTDSLQFHADIDLYVSSAIHQSFHLPYLETFAAGNTAVGADVGVGRELRSAGNPLGVYTPGSVDELVLALGDILENQKLYAVLARERKDVVIRTHHPRSIAERLDGIYRNLVETRRQAPISAGLQAGGKG